jgi:hypothetical protein
VDSGKPQRELLDMTHRVVREHEQQLETFQTGLRGRRLGSPDHQALEVGVRSRGADVEPSGAAGVLSTSNL